LYWGVARCRLAFCRSRWIPGLPVRCVKRVP